jgi:hypothetical protein
MVTNSADLADLADLAERTVARLIASVAVDRFRRLSFTGAVAAPRLYSLLCLETCSEELARVLSDAWCSFFDSEGRFHLSRPEVISGRRAEVGSFARSVLENPGVASASSTIDLTAGRVPGSRAEIANPIALLHWLIVQRAAVDFHPTVNAYIGSSDPDDILPFLPFHPAPGHGGEGDSLLVLVRVHGVEHVDAPGRSPALHLGTTDFLFPS